MPASTPPSRRPTSWALFLAPAAAAAFLIGEATPRPRATLLQWPAEVTARLQERGVPYILVPSALKSSEVGSNFFLCERDRSWEEVSRLWRAAEHGSSWAGVVLLERCPNQETAECSLAAWGPYGSMIGGVMLFGDPTMIRRIEAALQD
jgi:hypothetical protein